MSPTPASRKLFEMTTEELARALIGCLLWRQLDGIWLCGVIVETEAYLQDDAASHSFRGPTKRNAAMFGPPGRAYVYRIHQSHCFNVVTAPEGVGEAVLLRALAPLQGIGKMRTLRKRQRLEELTSGPGKLCQALALDLRWDKKPLQGPDIILEDRPTDGNDVDIALSARIGIRKNSEALLRFFDRTSTFVSRRLRPRTVEPPP